MEKLKFLRKEMSTIAFLQMSIVLSGCGGGGSDSPVIMDGLGVDQPDATSSGYIYYYGDAGDSHKLIRYDVSTKLGTVAFDAGTIKYASVSDDASQFGFVNSSGETTAIVDNKGALLYRFQVTGVADISGPVLFSPDNQLWMYEWDEKTGQVRTELRIRDSSGVKQRIVGGSQSYDWVSNDEIIFAQGQLIKRIKGLGLTGETPGEQEVIYQISNGRISHISISPDRNSLAFVITMTDAFDYSALYVLDLVNYTERQLTTSSQGLGNGITAIEWSPDGANIALASGLSGRYENAPCPGAYVIPAIADNPIDYSASNDYRLAMNVGGEMYWTCANEYVLNWRNN